MKKLNLKNQANDDDEKLIGILKDSIDSAPAEHFVEETLKKFLTLNAKQRTVHKPLKAPLYMMLAIGIILFFSIFMTFNLQLPMPSASFDLEPLWEQMAFQFNAWYALTPVLLVTLIMGVVWFELRLFNFRNPFD